MGESVRAEYTPAFRRRAGERPWTSRQPTRTSRVPAAATLRTPPFAPASGACEPRRGAREGERVRDPRSGHRRRPVVGAWAALALVAIVGAAGTPVRAASAAPESRRGVPPGATFRDCADCPQMVVVPAGRYTMGSVPEHRVETEQPAELQPVEIAIERPFALGKYEVTRREFARFVAATGYAVAPGCRTSTAPRARFDDDPPRPWRDPAVPATPRDDHPVAFIDWKT